MIHPEHIAEFAENLERYWQKHYVGKRPTDKQRAILVDRGYLVPATRREAAKIIGQIAEMEGWHE